MCEYVSLLRSINVGGKNKIKMLELRALYESMGFSNVSNYIQSGNVTFTSVSRDKKRMAGTIADSISKKFGFDINVLIKSKHALNNIIKENPYSEIAHKDCSKLHITFLLNQASKSAILQLKKIPLDSDEFFVAKDVIYLYCPNGYGRTKLTNTHLERILGVSATTRNFKTIYTLYHQYLDS